MPHYLTQHCYPAESVDYTVAMDEVLANVAVSCIPGLNPEDDITMRRLRLPPRMFGGGIRSLEALRQAAFVATVCRAVPRMIDSVSTMGEQRTGFMPPLVTLLGA
eukprot:1761192-Karenia_brevis.AAC.1